MITHAISRGLFSQTVCLSCLCNKPEKMLSCGHSICTIFGEQVDRHAFTLRTCVLCSYDTCGFNILLKPPTAGIRLLCVDGGGGVGALISLKVLKELQKAVSKELEFSYPIQENFDLAFGTSSGYCPFCC